MLNHFSNCFGLSAVCYISNEFVTLQNKTSKHLQSGIIGNP